MGLQHLGQQPGQVGHCRPGPLPLQKRLKRDFLGGALPALAAATSLPSPTWRCIPSIASATQLKQSRPGQGLLGGMNGCLPVGVCVCP